MQNLYKTKFPRRSDFELSFDILNMTETMFSQLQQFADHYDPNNDFEIVDLPKLSKKCKPSSFEQISTVDCPQTLLSICALENNAHNNRKSEFHKAGGIWDTCIALFKVLWNCVGEDKIYNHWYMHFSKEYQKLIPDKQSKIFAQCCKETYVQEDRRIQKVKNWYRDSDLDYNHFSTWVNEVDKEVHISCRGTKLSSEDLWHDVEVLLGYSNETYKRLSEYIKLVTTGYRGWLYSISGHSLGASTILELFSRDIHPEFGDVYLYNCPLSPIAPMWTNLVLVDKRFNMYLNLGDPISNSWGSFLTTDNNVFCNETKANPIKSHSIDQWV